MNVNCLNIGRGKESLNITNINILIRFNKTREIFPCITRILSILLTTAATSASVERANSTEHVVYWLATMRKCELFAAISRLVSKCL